MMRIEMLQWHLKHKTKMHAHRAQRLVQRFVSNVAPVCSLRVVFLEEGINAFGQF